MAGLDFSVEQRQMQELAKRFREEADGKKLKRQFEKELRDTVLPARREAESRLMSIGHGGTTPTDGDGLREHVRENMRTRVRSSGAMTGITVSVSKDDIRGLTVPGQRLNRKGQWNRGWRHPVYGNWRKWVQHTVHPDLWFDKPMQEAWEDVRKSAREVIEDVIKRLAK